MIILAAGALGGAIWGGIAGWLRARRDVNEVISTIMLNFVAVQMLSWMVHGPLMESSRAYPTSSPIASAAQLEFYFAPSRLNLGMLLAVVLAGACYMLLFNTSAGFELRAMGRNRRAATFFGIRIPALTVWVMALSGALAGLGGAVQVSAISHRLYEKLSPGWGFEAIAVALVARLNPLADRSRRAAVRRARQRLAGDAAHAGNLARAGAGDPGARDFDHPRLRHARVERTAREYFRRI